MKLSYHPRSLGLAAVVLKFAINNKKKVYENFLMSNEPKTLLLLAKSVQMISWLLRRSIYQTRCMGCV